MFIKFLPNEYVLRYRKGRLVSKGVGLSFHYLERFTSCSVIPISNNDADFIFNETTADYQNVKIQGQLTYRIRDYEKIASLMNFTVNLKTKQYNDNPMSKLSKRIINIAEVLVKNHVDSINLTEAIQSSEKLAVNALEQLKAEKELLTLGVEVTGFSILAVGANTETSRALEAKTREEILRQSDDALYERRSASIEQERKVKENELNTEISVEEKKKKIKETEISTQRLVLEKENELKRIKTQSDVEREKIKLEAQIELERKRGELASLKLENEKKDADAQAYRISVTMEAYNKLSADVLVALATLNMEPEKMIASAFEKLAVNSEKIGTLNITPDLLESLKVR